MSKKSFFAGLLTGIILTSAVHYITRLENDSQQVAEMVEELPSENGPITYLETPTSYEDKKQTSFQVEEVLDCGALAREKSDYNMYYGKTVLIPGENYYDKQIITIKNPQRVGTYKDYHNTLPVVDGEIIK